jgi:hypothetical protein
MDTDFERGGCVLLAFALGASLAWAPRWAVVLLLNHFRRPRKKEQREASRKKQTPKKKAPGPGRRKRSSE